MARLGFYQMDCESILSQIKHQEKQLRLKRRWLMGLPISKSECKQLRGPEFLKYRSLPESLLREDDIFYETIKMRVEEAFGVSNVDSGHCDVQDSLQLSDTPNITGVLVSCLDALTNKGLYLVARTLTGGSVKFEKTRKKMKKVVREYLPNGFRNQNHNHGQKKILTQLSHLLNDPQHFKENCPTLLTPTFQSHRAAAIKILHGLEDLSSQTLIAMHRKLRGVQGGMPQLQSRKRGWSRDYLISLVRKTSENLLSGLRNMDELQEPLAKAMAVAGLSLKLTPGWQNSFATDFNQFSPEIKSLQNEIVKAIWLLETNVRVQELKTLQLVLDPNAEVSNGCLRTAIKKMLTEYLFECNDMDSIPKSLLETLAIIIKSSQSTPRGFVKEETEEEVECILVVSAQTKQIVWDLLPDHELDQDFTDAYMEKLEESDDGDGDDNNDYCDDMELRKSQGSSSESIGSDNEVESAGESKPVDSRPPISTTKRHVSCPNFTPNKRLCNDFVERLDTRHFTGVHSDPVGTISSSQFQEISVHNGTVETNMNQCHAESKTRFGTHRNSSYPLISPNGRANGNSIDRHEAKHDTGGAKFMTNKQSSCRNQYLVIQEVCDQTSMVAYNLIGRMLEEFALEKGIDLDWSDSLYLRGGYSVQEDTQVEEEKKTSSEERTSSSVIVRVVEELMPSFPKSGIERLKELMGTQ